MAAQTAYRPTSSLPVKELAHPREESLGIRAALVVALGFLVEFLQQLALTAGEMLRRLHRDLDVHVAARRAAEHRESLGPQPELLAALRPCGDLHLGPAS